MDNLIALIPIIGVILIGLLIYFIPSFVAFKRHHLQKTPILLLNIFLGWSFIGWLIALIWATLKEKNVNTNPDVNKNE